MIKEKTIVVGLPGIEVTLEQLNYICTKYGKYIESFYLSPPFGPYYSWKGPTVPSDYTYQNCKLLRNQIDVIRKYDIKIRVVQNNPVLETDHPKEDIEKFIWLFGKPDYIVTMHQYIPEILQGNFGIPLAYSCMNAIYKTGFDTIKDCEVVVLNSEHNYNINLMTKLKAMGKQIEIIVNNSCGFWCSKSCDDRCTNLETKLVNTCGTERAMALQALFPCELKLFEPYVDLYKISNRPSTFEQTDRYLRTWTELPSLDELRPKLNYIKDYMDNYNMAAFRTGEHTEKPVDFDKVIDIKNEIWTKKLGRNIDIRNL